VDLLWQKGLVNAALELEGFWNRLSVTYPFCLFCAYSMETLMSVRPPQGLASICRAHSHSFADSASVLNLPELR
jgi:hypothetical protein